MACQVVRINRCRRFRRIGALQVHWLACPGVDDDEALIAAGACNGGGGAHGGVSFSSLQREGAAEWPSVCVAFRARQPAVMNGERPGCHREIVLLPRAPVNRAAPLAPFGLCTRSRLSGRQLSFARTVVERRVLLQWRRQHRFLARGVHPSYGSQCTSEAIGAGLSFGPDPDEEQHNGAQGSTDLSSH
jgi:hypothetical protein